MPESRRKSGVQRPHPGRTDPAVGHSAGQSAVLHIHLIERQGIPHACIEGRIQLRLAPPQSAGEPVLPPPHLGVGKRSQRAHPTAPIRVAGIGGFNRIRLNVQRVGRRLHCIPTNVDPRSDVQAIVEALRCGGVAVPDADILPLGFLPVRPKTPFDAGLFDGLNRNQRIPRNVPAGDG